MTDKIENPVEEKSEMEQLADVVKSEVSGKADVEALEAVKSAVEAIEIPSLEGLVKSEEVAAIVEKAVAEVREETEAKFAAMPAIVKKESPMTIDFENNTVDFGGTQVKGQDFDYIAKSVDGATNIAGSAVSTNNPFYTLKEMNPFRRLSTIIPVSGSTFKLPEVGGISWASEATKAANTLRTPGGTLSSSTVVIENWVSENAYSVASLEDVPSMDSVIAGLMAQELGAAEAADAVEVLNATSYANVNTGVAGNIPAAGNVVARMADMIRALSPAYLPGAQFLVSRNMYTALQSSNNTTLNYDPRTGVQTFGGYAVEVCEYLEAGDSAGDKSAYFGNFGRGLVMGARSSASIGRFDQTRPGHITYFGQARFKHAAWDDAALVSMTTAA